MDYHSRFSMTFTGLKKGDEIAFLNMFDHHLGLHVQQLMQMVIDDEDYIEESLDHYAAAHSGCTFHQRGDRSLQVTTNDVAWYFDNNVHENDYIPQDYELIKFDGFVNQLLRKNKNQKNYFSPHHEFLRNWLVDYSDCSDKEITQKINQFQQDEFDFYQQALKNDELETEIDTEETEQSLQSNSSNVINLDAFRKNAKPAKE